MIRDERYNKYIEKISQKVNEIKTTSGKKFLISGVSGMVGTVIIDVLINMNDNYACNYNIYGLGRNIERANDMFDIYENRSDFKFIQANINDRIPELGEIDYIIHAASNTHPIDYSGDPIGTISSNVIGTDNLLKYAIEHNCKRFEFVSSVEIYGENRGDVEAFDEEYCGYIDCNTLRAGYPESKRTGEALCQAYSKKYGLEFVVPRLCRTFGPTMSLRDSKAIAQFIKNAARGEDVVLKSEGKQYYSYIDVFQAVYAILYILSRGECANAYNVSSSNGEWYMRDIAEKLAKKAGTNVVYDLPDKTEKEGYSIATKAILDNSKLKDIGWEEYIDCEEVLYYTVDVLKSRI